MMSKLISRTALVTPLLLGIATAPALAQMAGSPFDPAQMPVTRGVVSQYDLSPRGDVDGLILTDGTEIHIAPYLGPHLLQSVSAGDSVTIHGLRARAIPLVQAMSVTDDKSGTTIADAMPAGAPPPAPPAPPGPPSGQNAQLHATVKMRLHGPRGELNGVLLADGTFVHLPPPDAARLADLLTPGTAIAVRGQKISSNEGRVIAATAIGPADGTLQPVLLAPPAPGIGPDRNAAPPPPPPPPHPPGPDAMGGPPAPPPPPASAMPPDAPPSL